MLIETVGTEIKSPLLAEKKSPLARVRLQGLGFRVLVLGFRVVSGFRV
jgi:hypothetical protein